MNFFVMGCRIISILSLCLASPDSRAFSFAEMSYQLVQGSCPKATVPEVSCLNSNCVRFDGDQRWQSDLRAFALEAEDQSLLAGLASMRATQLECVQKKLEHLSKSPGEMSSYLEEMLPRAIQLGHEKRKMADLEPLIGTDLSSREEYKNARLRAEVLIASMPYFEIPAMKLALLSIVNQTDQFGPRGPEDWFAAQMRKDFNLAIQRSFRDVSKTMKVLHDGVRSSGRSLSTEVRESLAQDTALVEAYRQSGILSFEKLKPIACRLDARYGRGAEYREAALTVLSVAGVPLGGGMIRLAAKVSASSIIGASAMGAIAQGAANILRVTAIATSTTRQFDNIVGSCFGDANQLAAHVTRACDLKVLGSSDAEKCLLSSTLAVLGATNANRWIRNEVGLRQERLAVDARIMAQRDLSLSKAAESNKALLMNPPRYPPVPMGKQYVNEDLGRSKRFGSKRVKYLSEKELEALKVKVVDGKVYGANGRPLETVADKKKAIFVMDERGEIYISMEQKVGKFHHSSFLGGRPASMAGEIEIINGQIVSVSSRSGHYMPGPMQIERFKSRLRDLGVQTEKVKFSTY